MIPMLINIKSHAYRDDETDEPINLLTYGQFSQEGGRTILEYDEVMDETMPAQHVVLTLENGSLTMIREGGYSTQMIFTQDCRYEGQYHTPYGAMDLALFCNRLKYDLTKDGGTIDLRYQLDINGQFAAVHELNLTAFPHNG